MDRCAVGTNNPKRLDIQRFNHTNDKPAVLVTLFEDRVSDTLYSEEVCPLQPMHITLINHYAGSPTHGMEFRPYQMARHWVEQGHEVSILAVTFSHLRNKNPDCSGRSTEELIDGIRYRWLKTNSYDGNGIGRMRSIFSFIRGIDRERRSFFSMHPTDCVIASSTYPFDIAPARRLADSCNAPLIWEVHDLWPLSPMELSGYTARHPFIRLTQRSEDRCCRDADRVVSILPRAIDHLKTRGLDPSKYIVIPNGVDVGITGVLDSTNPPANISAKIDALRKRHPFLIGYAGSHTDSYGIDVLLDAIRELREEGIGAVLIGDGPEKGRLIERAKDLRNVLFLDRMSRLEALVSLRACSSIFVGLKAQPLFRFGIGMNKIFDGMLVERPVLACYTAGNDPVGEAGCGITVPAGDTRGVVDALRRLKSMDPESRRDLGNSGRRFVCEHHDYGRLAERFLDVIRNAIAETGARR